MTFNRILVLYGSETGTAQDIAERIWREGKMIGLKGPVLAMDDYDITRLIYEDIVIFVCSTTGQGDIPSNMKNFWSFILRKKLPENSLQNVRFAVLGLGDSSYSKFNYTGKKLYRRLLALGGREVVKLGLADDQHDLGADAVVDPWISELWQTLFKSYSDLVMPSLTSRPLSKWKVKIVEGIGEKINWPISKKSFKVTVSSNIRTTPEEHFQKVHLINFTSDSDLKYKSGDVAVLRPENRKESVEALFTVMSHWKQDMRVYISERDSDMPVPYYLQKPLSLVSLATSYWDLNASPRRYVFQLLSHITPNELEREKLSELASAEGQQDMYSYCTRPRRTIVEVLADFPHAASNIPPDYLFDIFLPIRPRFFSIASPPQSKYVEVLVAVVQYKTMLSTPRYGLCSTWLSHLAPGTELDMAIVLGTLNFNLERHHLIMVGPGTGVAPFRSYICSDEGTQEQGELQIDNQQDLSEPLQPALATKVLVFGCRNSQSDFHFKQDLMASPSLQLFTAFSRDQPHKIYVQHVISENSHYFYKLLSKKCCIMVAGNAKEMPDSVRCAFVNAFIKEGNMSNEKAEKCLESMEAKGYYQTETWS